MRHRAGQSPESKPATLEIIEFTLEARSADLAPAPQAFGINVAKVREIVRMPKLTSMPRLPAGLRGLFTLREELITAVDLNYFLQGKTSALDSGKMIISEFSGVRCGFMVQDVSRIHRLSWAQLEGPEMLEDFQLSSTAITGILRLNERLILLLDVEQIVAAINPKFGLQPAGCEPRQGFEGCRILLVEDSAMVRHALNERLKSAGMNVVSKRNGNEAWEYLQQAGSESAAAGGSDRLPDLIITDIEMPGMDGRSLTERIKSHAGLREIPVVIFSSLTEPAGQPSIRTTQADARLTKPHINSLLDAVYRLLRQKPGAAG